MSTVTREQVAQRMASLPRTTARPRTTVLGDGELLRERAACEFVQVRSVPEGSAAWRLGEREYEHAGLYVLGPRPMAYLRGQAARNDVVFEDQGGQRWYVAGYADADAVRSHPEFHPFGVWFLLMRDYAQREPEPEVERFEVLM